LLMKKGAEADLFLEEWHGMKVIVKKRVRKAYRIPQLDDEIRNRRKNYSHGVRGRETD